MGYASLAGRTDFALSSRPRVLNLQGNEAGGRSAVGLFNCQQRGIKRGNWRDVAGQFDCSISFFKCWGPVGIYDQAATSGYAVGSSRKRESGRAVRARIGISDKCQCNFVDSLCDWNGDVLVRPKRNPVASGGEQVPGVQFEILAVMQCAPALDTHGLSKRGCAIPAGDGFNERDGNRYGGCHTGRRNDRSIGDIARVSNKLRLWKLACKIVK